VSSTVKDLVAGSGILFEDRGERQLKGVPGTWRIFTATHAEPSAAGARAYPAGEPGIGRS
jgi:hypothetical protein